MAATKLGDMDQSNIETATSRWNWLYKVSGAASLLVGGLFLVAVIDLVINALQRGPIISWLSLFQNNWLVIIFKLHAGFSGVQPGLLYGLSLLDLTIMALVCTVALGLYTALRRTNKIWSIIALTLPFTGIMLYIATKIAGRSSVMGVGLVISVVMLRSQLFSKFIAYMGILASVLLLAGDFSVGVPQSNVIATLFGIGYVLLTTWFFLVGRRLLQSGLGDREGARSKKCLKSF